MNLRGFYTSPLGQITMETDGEALLGLWLPVRSKRAEAHIQTLQIDENSYVFRLAGEWLDRYFAGEKPAPKELPIAPSGTDFRLAVWWELCEIPYGETMTYAEMAKIIGQKRGKARMAPPAVGTAASENPISIVIPCHRLIGTGGRLSGYAGGVEAKRTLLLHEGAISSAASNEAAHP